MVKHFVLIWVVLLTCLLLGGCKEEKFAIKGVSPRIGILGGGEPIEIHGSGFHTGMGLAVYFGNKKAQKVAIRGPKKLTVSSPSASDPGPIDIRVVTDDGKELLLPGVFTYVEKSQMDIRDIGKRKSLRDQ